jgi:hypothetical protein
MEFTSIIAFRSHKNNPDKTIIHKVLYKMLLHINVL